MHRSESIILSKRPYREADLMITFFSKKDGKVGGVARSAKKSKKRFGGILETGYILDMHYAMPGSGDLVNVSEAALLSPKVHREFSLGETYALWLAMEVASRYLPDAEASREKFELLRRFVTTVHEGRVTRGVLLFFLFRWITLAGYLPEISSPADVPGFRFNKEGLGALKRIVAGDIKCDINDGVFKELLMFVFNYSGSILGKPLKMEASLQMLMDL